MTRCMLRILQNDRIVRSEADVSPVIDSTVLQTFAPGVKTPHAETYSIPDDIAEKLVSLYDAPIANPASAYNVKLSDLVHVRALIAELLHDAHKKLLLRIYEALKENVKSQAEAEAYQNYGYAAQLRSGAFVVVAPDAVTASVSFGDDTSSGGVPNFASPAGTMIKTIWPEERTIPRTEIISERLPIVLLRPGVQISEKLLSQKLAKHNAGIKTSVFAELMSARIREELKRDIVITPEDLVSALKAYFREKPETSLVCKLASETAAHTVSQTAGTRFVATAANTRRRLRRKNKHEEKREWRLLEYAPEPEIDLSTNELKKKILSSCGYYTPKDFYRSLASNSILTRQGQRVSADVGPDYDKYQPHYADQTIYSTVSNNYYFFNRPRISKYSGFRAPFLGYASDSRLNTPISKDFKAIIDRLAATSVWNSRITDNELANHKKELSNLVRQSRFTPQLDWLTFEKFRQQDTDEKMDVWNLDHKLKMLAYVADVLGPAGIKEIITTEEISIDDLANKAEVYGWTAEKEISLKPADIATDKCVNVPLDARIDGQEFYEEAEQEEAQDITPSDFGVNFDMKEEDEFVFIPSFEYDPDAEKCEVNSIDNIDKDQLAALAEKSPEELEKLIPQYFGTDNINRIAIRDALLRKNLYQRRVPLLSLEKTGYEAMGISNVDHLKTEEQIGLNVLGKQRRQKSTDLLTSSGTEGYADIKDDYLYLDALRFTNTVSRSREEYEQRAIEEAALKKIGRAEVGNDIEI